MAEPDRPEPDHPESEPPPEPFAYLSSPGRIREPWALIISFGLLALFGIWVMIVAAVTEQSTGGLIVSATIMIILLGVGGFGIYMGIRRLQWKRTYRRIVGRNPW